MLRTGVKRTQTENKYGNESLGYHFDHPGFLAFTIEVNQPSFGKIVVPLKSAEDEVVPDPIDPFETLLVFVDLGLSLFGGFLNFFSRGGIARQDAPLRIGQGVLEGGVQRVPDIITGDGMTGGLYVDRPREVLGNQADVGGLSCRCVGMPISVISRV